MSYDGSHLICEKHSAARRYCDAEERWVCKQCEIEEGRIIFGVAKRFKRLA